MEFSLGHVYCVAGLVYLFRKSYNLVYNSEYHLIIDPLGFVLLKRISYLHSLMYIS